MLVERFTAGASHRMARALSARSQNRQIIAEFFNEIGQSASFGSCGLVAPLTEHWVAARNNAS
jgi:hypothetical protein